MADCGQWDAVRDTNIQEREQVCKLRAENEDILREIRKVRRAIMENLQAGTLEPIDKVLDKTLGDRLEKLKAIFL